MRECGILLPIFSLPSPYGIGCFSKEAYRFVDQLKLGGQNYWQILPLGPTGYGDSPYQSFSAFAGNPYFLDLETFISEGLLTAEECAAADFGTEESVIDYGKLYENRFPLLNTAYERWLKKTFPQEKDRGLFDSVHHLADLTLGYDTREYCFYMAIKDQYQGAPWIEWDEEIRLRKPTAIEKWRESVSKEIAFYEFLQMEFNKQWTALKSYANFHGIKIIGDIPIYVAFDSADAWVHPELFQFDDHHLPLAVAGCPPDGFSADGQLWGNPLYDWPYHQSTGYSWWIDRLTYNFALYDVLRIDHFRGFDQYYSIPFGAENAVVGEWENGPGIDFFQQVQMALGRESLPIIAEDLGFLTPSVEKLLRESCYPGMKVLEFAFDSREESDYLPHNFSPHCVVYTGTHDNETIVGWYDTMDIQDHQFANQYIGVDELEIGKIHWAFIRLALASVANLAIIPMQDYLGLGSEARINEPATLGKNWKWRMYSGADSNELMIQCRKMATLYGRLNE